MSSFRLRAYMDNIWISMSFRKPCSNLGSNPLTGVRSWSWIGNSVSFNLNRVWIIYEILYTVFGMWNAMFQTGFIPPTEIHSHLEKMSWTFSHHNFHSFCILVFSVEYFFLYLPRSHHFLFFNSIVYFWEVSHLLTPRQI